MQHLQKYINHYENHLDKATAKATVLGAGGQVRASTSNLVESLAELIWTNETNGSVRVDTYTISNPQGDTLDFSVDKHCYSVNGKLKLILECKAYLDRCYLLRADHDMEMIKTSLGKKNRDVKFAILALETAVSENALKFYLGRDNIDDVFFLLGGKRVSSKPIWKTEYRKQINEQLLSKVVSYVQRLK